MKTVVALAGESMGPHMGLADALAQAVLCALRNG